MLLSQTSEYALRAVLYIAGRDGPARAAEIADAAGVPQNYMAKTLHQLVRSGVLVSTRGPSGGFRLAVAPRQLTLQDVVSAFAVSAFAARGTRRCLLGRGVCGAVPDCPVHAGWTPVATRIEDFFAHTTVATLLPNAPPTREVNP